MNRACRDVAMRGRVGMAATVPFRVAGVGTPTVGPGEGRVGRMELRGAEVTFRIFSEREWAAIPPALRPEQVIAIRGGERMAILSMVQTRKL